MLAFPASAGPPCAIMGRIESASSLITCKPAIFANFWASRELNRVIGISVDNGVICYPSTGAQPGAFVLTEVTSQRRDEAPNGSLRLLVASANRTKYNGSAAGPEGAT